MRSYRLPRSLSHLALILAACGYGWAGAPSRVSAAPPTPAVQPDPRDAEIFGEAAIPTPQAKTTQPAPPALAPADLHPATQPARPPAPPPSTPTATLTSEQRLASAVHELGSERLQLGGLIYLRFNAALSDSHLSRNQRLSMPNLCDVYLDSRPNERVRGFVRGRLVWDPSVDPSSTQALLLGSKQLQPQLNELWLKFDLARRLFVTLGQQRVLWGATRLWNPVDFINREQRAVLSPFDGRNGVPMVKLHLPIEALGWNVYLAGLVDRVSRFDRIGVVGRAEVVWSTVELGLSGSYRRQSDPRLGLDLSAGIWDLDLSAEVALSVADRFKAGVSPQASVGAQYAIKVFDQDQLYLGAEYFFNDQGTTQVNPLDLYSGKRQFFYAGRHYAALYASLPKPGALDRWTFTATGLANLSDRSAIARLDVAVTFLTFLTVQAFAGVHLGHHGELRLGDQAFPAADRDLARALLDPAHPTSPIPTQVLDLGLWLRLDI